MAHKARRTSVVLPVRGRDALAPQLRESIPENEPDEAAGEPALSWRGCRVERDTGAVELVEGDRADRDAIVGHGDPGRFAERHVERVLDEGDGARAGDDHTIHPRSMTTSVASQWTSIPLVAVRNTGAAHLTMAFNPSDFVSMERW